jgi:peptidoglycan/xylan/chitin deacetylase (PgdA/CDA1 family)
MLKRLGSLGLGSTGLATWLVDRRSVFGRALVILCYHRVVPMRDPDDFPYDSDLVSATPEEFQWQMRFVRRHFTVVSIDRITAALRGEAELPPRALCVTFDDGYNDCVRYVLPVLKAEGLPAAVFVASGHIGSHETFWFDQLAYAIQRTEVSRLELPEIGISERVGARRAERRGLYGQVVEAMKTVPDEVRVSAIETIKRQCRVREDASDRELSRPMNAEQLVEASRNGFSIQSHTVSHPILANVDAARLRSELADSRTAIGNITGMAPDALAYPNGTWSDFGQREVNAARNCGYQAAMTYESGFQMTDSIDPFRLLRLPVNWRHSRSWFRTMLAVPELAASLPAPEGHTRGAH